MSFIIDSNIPNYIGIEFPTNLAQISHQQNFCYRSSLILNTDTRLIRKTQTNQVLSCLVEKVAATSVDPCGVCLCLEIKFNHVIGDILWGRAVVHVFDGCVEIDTARKGHHAQVPATSAVCHKLQGEEVVEETICSVRQDDIRQYIQENLTLETSRTMSRTDIPTRTMAL